MAAPVKEVVKPMPKWLNAFRKWYFNRMYYPQLGLKSHDALYETPEVKEAIQRLPKDVYDARMLRINRALILSAGKTVLPKEEWTKLEDDDHYLNVYLKRIKAEKAEKKKWLRM